MEEKIIIKSKLINVSLIRNIIFAIGLVVSVLAYLIAVYSWQKWFWMYTDVSEMGLFQFIFSEYRPDNYIWVLILPLLGFILIGLIVYFLMNKTEMIITDKRVFGRAAFGKRVDLPLDSISAVGTGLLNSIAVATSSGKIRFMGLKNRDEIHKAISDLLIERQKKQEPVHTTTIKQEIPQSNADEIKKYKELLDSGVITQEEFDAKKKQLLGL